MFPMIEADADKREDARGWLQVLYESDTMVLKRSFSRAGVFRGLHAQIAPAAQVKIIRVAEGRIIDVVVAMDDPKAAIHHIELTPTCGWVRIDANYLHGFYAVEDSVFEYVCDGRYDENLERAASIEPWLRDTLGLTDVVLSDKDRAAAPLAAPC